MTCHRLTCAGLAGLASRATAIELPRIPCIGSACALWVDLDSQQTPKRGRCADNHTHAGWTDPAKEAP